MVHLPTHIGPAEFSDFCGMVAVRCPSDLEPLARCQPVMVSGRRAGSRSSPAVISGWKFAGQCVTSTSLSRPSPPHCFGQAAGGNPTPR
jgi:hypothetical protein